MANILLLEQEPILAGLIRSALYSDGHQISEASSLHAAVELGRQANKQFDLILAEVNQGMKLTRLLSPQKHDVKIMFMTDYIAVGEAISSVWEGVSVLEKPFTAHKLRRTVRETLYKD